MKDLKGSDVTILTDSIFHKILVAVVTVVTANSGRKILSASGNQFIYTPS